MITSASKGILAASAGLVRTRGVRSTLTALPEPGPERYASPDSLIICGDFAAGDFWNRKSQ